jgi:hypothetical protein|tara:strand:+ start:3289 stop:4248 length:960 start_codon:yes stop_codon:yes gene_type:complete
MELSSSKTIEDEILNNYVDYQHLFINFQSKFLSSLYSRYQSLESGKIVLHFARETHQDILRQKDYDLNFNISYENFWENHSKTKPRQRSLIKIAEDILLPKETIRRKILLLIKQKVLSKKNKNIAWLPNEQYKQNYSSFINEEVNDVSKLIIFICEKNKIKISREVLTEELKKKFSFFWFHYLGAQIEYLKLWNKQLNDLELVFITLQVASLFTKKAKEKGLSHSNIYNNPALIKNFISASVGATSISEVTGIPRATCLRKLETLVKNKIISKDKNSKRYYLIPNSISEDLISLESTKGVVKIFSNFFFICLRAMNVKT